MHKAHIAEKRYCDVQYCSMYLYKHNSVDNVLNTEKWLVGCFGLNGLLRQYFSLYQAVSQREGEKR